jgi:hypothetical protein
LTILFCCIFDSLKKSEGGKNLQKFTVLSQMLASPPSPFIFIFSYFSKMNSKKGRGGIKFKENPKITTYTFESIYRGKKCYISPYQLALCIMSYELEKKLGFYFFFTFYLFERNKQKKKFRLQFYF